MDCAICIEPMLTESYISTSAQDDVVDSKDPLCIRMKCGHSFHTSCIIGCLRSGKACPTCREDINPAPQTQQLLVFDSDDFEFDAGPMLEEDPVVKLLDQQRMIIRVRKHVVRKAREKFNKSSKSYRILCEKLKIERRHYIQKALKEFSDLRRKEYYRSASIVRKDLAAVKIVEFKELREKFSEDELSHYEEWVDIEYDPKELMKSNDVYSPDPLTRAFWRG